VKIAEITSAEQQALILAVGHEANRMLDEMENAARDRNITSVRSRLSSYDALIKLGNDIKSHRTQT
jgi:hypothetical protein